MNVRVISKKTRGGLFVQFEISSPSQEENDALATEPPGAKYEGMLKLEEEMRRSGEICDSPETGFQERIEPISDSSFAMGGYFELRDQTASEVFIERLQSLFEGAEFDVDEL